MTAREFLKRLGCQGHILVRFRKPKIFWPDKVVYECATEGDRLEVIPIVWPEAPWLSRRGLNDDEQQQGLRNLGVAFEFPDGTPLSTEGNLNGTNEERRSFP